MKTWTYDKIWLGFSAACFVLASASHLAGCGLHVDPIQVSGEVHHVIEFDAVKLQAFFAAFCDAQHHGDTPAIDSCVSTELAQFWNAVVAAAPNPVPSTQPSP